MSNSILLGVLRTPPQLWYSDAFDIQQRHDRYLQAADKIERMADALDEICRRNLIRNDKEAYLYELAHYGLGNTKQKPNPSDYGQEVLNERPNAKRFKAKTHQT